MKQKTKNIMKRVFAIILLIAFVALLVMQALAMFTPASAADLKNDVLKSQSLQKKLEAEIDQIKEEREGATAEKKVVDNEIAGLDTEISTLNTKIANLNAEIVQKQKEMDEANAKIEAQKESFKKRMKYIYESGGASSNYVDVVFEAQSINDMFYRYEIAQVMVEHDKKLLSDMEEAQRIIAEAKAVIEKNKAEVDTSKQLLVARKATADQKRQQQVQLIDKLSGELKEKERAYEAARAEEERARSAMVSSLSTTSSSTKYTGGKFAWPTAGYTTITSPYGMRMHPTLHTTKMHTGVDIGAPMSATVSAANPGKVVRAEYNAGYGNYIVIDHGGGYSTLYAHASRLLVSAGVQVTRGQAIMKVGSTGYSTGPHLHFEIMINGKTQNPMSYY